MGKFLISVILAIIEFVAYSCMILGVLTAIFIFQAYRDKAYIFSTNDNNLKIIVQEALENEKTRKAKENVLEDERNKEQGDVSDQE